MARCGAHGTALLVCGEMPLRVIRAQDVSLCGLLDGQALRLVSPLPDTGRRYHATANVISRSTVAGTGLPPVTYRNHWPRPICSKMAMCMSAPASFVPPAMHSTAAASTCTIQSVMCRAFDGDNCSDTAKTVWSDIR